MSELTFDNVTTSDPSSVTNAVVEFNSTGSALQGLYILNSFAGNAGQGPAVRMDAGTLTSCHVLGANGIASSWVVDGNGNPVGGCSAEKYERIRLPGGNFEPGSAEDGFVSAGGL